MRRCPRALVALLCLAFAAAGCGTAQEPRRLARAVPAPAGEWRVGWSEAYGSGGAELRFRVEAFRVTARGWAADVAVENATGVTWQLAPEGFGVLLFADDDLAALERASRNGELPPPRRARAFAPAPPAELAPQGRWRGTISAPGTLPAGAWVRVVFGRFSTTAPPPPDVQPVVTWITDNALRLPPAP